MSAEELKRFYKAKAKKPELFDYDDDGNLVELNKEGSVIKTYSLPNYRPPTYEEIDEMESKRTEAIAIANKEFEDARRELRNLAPDTPDSDVLRVNRKVKEADVRLQAIRFPLHYIQEDFGIPINKIDFDKTFEKRKYPYIFFFLKTRPFTLENQYVRTGKAPVKPLISVAEARAAADAANTPVVILFENPETNDYGFLSLKWTVEIEFNNTMYNSAKQAIAAELAKVFNDQESLQRIMIADTPEEVSYELDDVPGDENQAKWNDNIKQLLYDVNIAKFNQYPELVTRLLETKTAILGAYIPNDNLIGIGLSLDNIQSKNPINWTGQNLLGKALMDIREKIRSDMALATESAATESAATESTATESTATESATTQKVVRRRKPPIAQPPIAATVPTPIEAVPQDAQLQSVDDTGPIAAPSVGAPSVGPRTIRRRPQVAVPTQLEPISLSNVPITINKI
jgi:ribA/ribD-fused uncharacterized protein